MGEENTTPVSKNPTAVPFSLDRDGINLKDDRIKDEIRRRILKIRDKCGCTNNEQFSIFLFGDKSSAKTIDSWTLGKEITIPGLASLVTISCKTGASLDWLVFGKGNLPPELQKRQGKENKPYSETELEREEKTDNETEPGNTVQGFLAGLSSLSLRDYVQNFKIDVHGHDYFYHDVKISFSISPLQKPLDQKSHDYQPLSYQCDTVSYLINGLRDLSNPLLLSLPINDEILLSARKAKYKQILNAIPLGQKFSNREKKLESFFAGDIAFYQNDNCIIEVFLPKNY